MIKAFKFRIYPNAEQEEIFAKHLGSCRFAYNWGLAKKIEHYQQNKEKVSCFEQQTEQIRIRWIFKNQINK